jgi:hypothetical protein
MVLAEGANEVMWLRQLLIDIGQTLIPKPKKVWTNNKCLSIEEKPRVLPEMDKTLMLDTISSETSENN